MKSVKFIVGFLALLLVTGEMFGESVGFWSFDDGKPGDTAAVLSSRLNDGLMQGKASTYKEGAPPAFDRETPATEIWDGGTLSVASPENKTSLRFVSAGASDSQSPAGGEVSISGGDPITHPADLTVEAFVKVNRQMPHHALIASKRRNVQVGATWSLSIDPEGCLNVRFDTQTEQQSAGFNRSFGSSAVLSDGLWHHVAMTYDHATLTAAIYVDYEKCGGGVTVGPLVYDGSVLVLGRGLDGWLDEVRLTPEALHPEQFLRGTQFFSDIKEEKSQPVFLDQTHSRVQSALDPDLQRIGTLIPKSVGEIETPMWSLGCETLDRGLASWEAYRGYLQPLGIKRIRLQGGWNRTEKEKGKYDFAWLDRVVDDAIALGLEVCLETSYNNHLYEPGSATGPGGKLPAGEETLAAWDKWVEAMVRRYEPKGVKEWMMYNEPNLNKANTLDLIVENNIRTAEIIKRVDPEARIGAFVLAGLNVKSLEDLLTKINAQGKSGLFSWAIYHGYSGNPDRLNGPMKELKAMMKRVAPNVRPWQGEAGCASEEVQYALSGIAWTEYSHAKWNARRMLCDFGHDVDSSVFTISDVAYHKDFISRYGLLKTNPDNSIIKVKTAYYTVQNMVSIFNAALELVPDYGLTTEGTEKELTWFAFRDKKSGMDVVTLWDGTELPSNESDIELVNVTVKNGHFETPVWIDLITGNVYEIPAEQLERQGDTVLFKDMPVYDGPGVITDRSLLSIEPARETNGKAKKPKKAPTASAPKMKEFLLPGTQQPAPAVLILGSWNEALAGIVKWLNGQDVHAFVVESDGDAKAAIKYVKSRAAEWQIKTDSVGVLYFGSAEQVADANADFKMQIGKKDGELLEAGTWQVPLAALLEKRKGKVFE